MSFLDLSLEVFPNGELAFPIIFVLRALQGVSNGLTFVIVQVFSFLKILCPYCNNELQSSDFRISDLYVDQDSKLNLCEYIINSNL